VTWLPLLIAIAMAVLPPIILLGVRLVFIVIHRGEESERSRTPWSVVRLRRVKRAVYVAGGLYGLVVVGCGLWWVAIDLAPRLGIDIPAPLLAWGISWIIIFLAFFIVLITAMIRGLLKKYPPPPPDAPEQEKDAWRNRYYEGAYEANSLKKIGLRILMALGLVVLMGLSAWIASLFMS
jgi:hypothetical protein